MMMVVVEQVVISKKTNRQEAPITSKLVAAQVEVLE